MSSFQEKAQYVKGLADGLEITPDTKERRLLLSIVDMLSDMAAAVGKVEEAQDELDDYVGELAEDIHTIENALADLYAGALPGEDEDDEDEDFLFPMPPVEEKMGAKLSIAPPAAKATKKKKGSSEPEDD